VAYVRKLAIVIPSRNRAALAKNAIQSVLDQVNSEIQVFVSDNSTDDVERESLRDSCYGNKDPRLGYLKPPQPLPMADHWEWAVKQALAVPDISHILFLTDRMVFKQNGLRELLEAVRRYPGKVISYNHDRIDDLTKPIRLEQFRWSGLIFELNTSDLLAAAAELRWHFWVSLPRMLNCVVPRDVLEAINMRFGNIFSSIAPDFCFAYRCLETLESIFYFDKALLVHYAQDRSNGSSQLRGNVSKDHADFLNNLKGKPVNYLAPIPEFKTVMNAIVHEYCFVQQETRSLKFRPVNRKNYLDYIAFEITGMPESSIKQEMLALAAKHMPCDGGKFGAVTNFHWSPAPVTTLFETIESAVEFAKLHSRDRDLGVTYEEANLKVKIVPFWRAIGTASIRFLHRLAVVLNRISPRSYRFLETRILWRWPLCNSGSP